MAAMISGVDSGLSNSSASILNLRQGNAALGRGGDMAYVNVGTGNLVLQRQDELLVGRGPDIAALRTYNSLGTVDGDNNDNWNAGFYRQLLLVGPPNQLNSTVTRIAADGSKQTYSYDSVTGKYLSKDGAGAFDSVVYSTTSGKWGWTDGDTGNTESWQWNSALAVRQLISEADASGNTITYSYNSSGLLTSVTSPGSSGTSINRTVLTYDTTAGKTRNLISLVSTAWDTTGATSKTQTSVNYSYDSSNRLVAVVVDPTPANTTDTSTYHTLYGYDGTSKRVNSIRRFDGTSLSFTYTAAGRIASMKDNATSAVTSFSYNTTTNASTTVTDPLGNITTYEYHSTSKQLGKITTPTAGGTTATRQFSYDSDGNVKSIVDGEGRQVDFEYDPRGNQTLQRDAAGHTVKRSFNARNQLETETVYLAPDPDGAGALQPGTPLTTRYVHDAGGKNLLRFEVSPEGRVTEYRYDGFGQRTSVIRHTADFYDTSALGQTSVPAEAALVTWVNARGDKTKISRTDMTYDFRGQIASSTSYESHTSDSSGNLSGYNTATTSYVYDPSGLLLKTIAVSNGVGQETSWTYDGLGRMLTSTDAQARITSWIYDDIGNKSTQVLAGGLRIISTYDKSARLISVVKADTSNTALATTRYHYDNTDRLRLVSDPTGVRQWTLYDNGGRVVGEIDGDGTLTEYAYNKNDQLTQTIVYATAAVMTNLTLNATDGSPTAIAMAQTLANVRPSSSSADDKNWIAYDVSGRQVKTVDAGGAVSEFQYDGDGGLIARIDYANTIATGTLGAQPAATAIMPASDTANDRTTRYYYTGDGALRATLNGEGALTETLYDAAGRAWKTVEYATRVTAAVTSSTAIGTIRPTVTSADISSYSLYDGRDKVSATVDGEGYLTAFAYDLYGNRTSTIRYDTKLAATVISSLTSNTSVATIRPATKASDQTVSATYDKLNRLASETDAEGTRTDYTYASNGLLSGLTRAAGSTEARTSTRRYDLQGRLSAALSGLGSAALSALGSTASAAQVDAIYNQYGTRHAYDAADRLINSIDANGNKTLYYYDNDGRLTVTVNALGEVTTTSWNQAGLKTSQTRFSNRVASASLATLAGGLSVGIPAGSIPASSPFDNTERFSYNADGTLASSTDALGNVTTYFYNAFDEATAVTRPIAANSTVVTNTAYDRRGLQLTQTIDAGGLNVVTRMEYDAFGRIVKATDANGNASSYSFDRLGRQVTNTDALSNQRSSTYDAFDRVLTQTDALGNTTSTSYDSASRSLTITTAENISVTTTYNRHGQTLSVKDGKGSITTYDYDANGNLTRSSQPENRSTSQKFDNANRLIETTDARGTRTRLSYDAANRVLTRTVDPTGLNLSTRYSYDPMGQQLSVTDPKGIVTRTTYDAKGQVTKQQRDADGLNLVTSYSFDALGRTLTVTDPASRVIRYRYDKMDRRIEECVDPDGLKLTTSYVYDANGNVLGTTDANGNKTAYQYDASNRQQYVTDPMGYVSQNTYDKEGRLIQTRRYANASFNVNAVTSSINDRTERKEYDKDGRLSAAIDGNGAVTRFGYDANGNLAKTTAHANLVSASQKASDVVADAARDQTQYAYYDAANRKTWDVDAAVAVITYTYDANGNLTSRNAYANLGYALANSHTVAYDSTRDQTTSYVYDTADRLAKKTEANGLDVSYSYDGGSNLIRKTESFGGSSRTTQYQYDGAARLTRTTYPDVGVYIAETTATLTASGLSARSETAQSLSTGAWYDAAGNVVVSEDTAGNRRYQAWDSANRLRYEIDAEGYVTGYQRDSTGNVTALTRYAAAIARSTRDTWGTSGPSVDTITSLVAVANTANRLISTGYDARGGAVAITLPSIDAHDGSSAFNASPITKHTYNAFGEVMQTEVFKRDTTWLTTNYYYDQRGRALTSIDALGYVTSAIYDAFGNVIERKEYAQSTPTRSTSAFTTPTADAKRDRTFRTTWDRNNRKLAETRVGVEVLDTTPGGVTVYTDANYAGTWWTYDHIGRSGLSGLGLPNDTLSSLKVRDGWQVTLYDNSDFTGDTLAVTADTDISLTFNDKASSIAVVGSQRKDLGASYAYDAFGNLITSKDAADNVTRTYYDKANQIRAVVGPERSISANASFTPLTEFTRDYLGNVTRQTERANGASSVNDTSYVGSENTDDRTTTAVFDAWGRVIESKDAMDKSQYFSLDKAGNLAKQWQGVSTSGGQLTLFKLFDYDANGRLLHIVEPPAQDGRVAIDTRMEYNAFGEMTRKYVDAFGRDKGEYFDYDNGGSVWRTNSGSGVNRVMLYDLQGNQTATLISDTADLTTASGPSAANALTGLRRTSNQYDALGRVTTQTTAASGKILQTWDRWGNRLSVTDARDSTFKTQYAYNANNQLVTETKPNIYAHITGNTYANVSPVTRYYYDVVGNLSATMDARGSLDQKEWDKAGKLVYEHNADGGSIKHEYNAFGEEVKRTDARNNATTYTHDKLGRMTGMTRPHAWMATKPAMDADAVTLYSQENYGGASQTFGLGAYNMDATFNDNVGSLKVKPGYKAVLFADINFKGRDSTKDNISIDGRSTDAIIDENRTRLDSGYFESDAFQPWSSAVSSIAIMRDDELDPPTFHSGSSLAMSYDELGRKLSVQNTADEVTTYQYDLRANVTRVDQPGQRVIVNNYDAHGRKTQELTFNTSSTSSNSLQTWTYDYFGRPTGRTDVGYASYTYAYDKAGQLTGETNTRGRNVTYTYDLAGRLTNIKDYVRKDPNFALRDDGSSVNFDHSGASDSGDVWRNTQYGYDTAGNRTREKVSYQTTRFILEDRRYRPLDSIANPPTTEQNQTLTYDSWGQLKSIMDNVLVNKDTITYDTVGNRALEDSQFYGKKYYAYDAMNRQILVNGINDNSVANSNIKNGEGRLVSYDSNGNRIQDVYKDGNGALATETYEYDSLNRLNTIRKNGSTIDTRVLDKADRLIRGTGKDSQGKDTQFMNNYDDAGRMIYQSYSTGGTVNGYAKNEYDFAGNLTRSERGGAGVMGATNFLTVKNDYEYVRTADGQKQSKVTARRSDADPGNAGVTTMNYDVNGYLYEVTDNSKNANNRLFFNDANGQVLRKRQGTNDLRNLIVNGQVMSVRGYGVDPNNPTNGTGDPNIVWQSNTDFVYRAIDAAYPGSGPGSYRVQSGDTLQSLARSAYGDAALWYLIADANGLAGSAALIVGQVLTMPATVGTVHNNASTFKPYNAAAVIGDTSPYTVPPVSGNNSSANCAQIAIIIVAVITAVVVTIATAGAASAALGAVAAVIGGTVATAAATTAGAVGIGAVAGAVGGFAGSLASQGVMIAGGLQKDVSWTDVAIGAATGFVGGGLGSAGAAAVQGLKAGSGFVAGVLGASLAGVRSAQTVSSGVRQAALLSTRVFAYHAAYAAREVVTDAVGQGIRIGAEKQAAFDWRQTAVAAASASGGLLGSAAGNLIENNGEFDPTRFAIDVAGSASGMVSGRAARARASEARQGGQARAVVLSRPVDDASLRSARALYNKQPGRSAFYQQITDAEGASTLRLLAGRERDLDSGKLMIVGHGGEAMAHDAGRLAATLRARGVQNLSKAAVIACNAAQNDDGGSLLRSTFDAMKRNGILTSVSGHTGRIQVDNAGRRFVDSVGSMKLTLSAQGALTAQWSRRVNAAPDEGWLGRAPSGMQINRGAAPRRPAFPSFVNQVRQEFTPAGVASHTAHRLSYNNIGARLQRDGVEGSMDMIRALTIPRRRYGEMAAGDTRFFDLVMSAPSDAERLRLLNASPFNLRPGNASVNSGIRDRFDPNRTPGGSWTPQSQALGSFASQRDPQDRSSSLLSDRLRLAEYEGRAIEAWTAYRPAYNPNWFNA